MMRINSVSAQPDRAGRYAVVFAYGTRMRLYRQTIEDFGLYAGRELSETEYQALCEAAGAMSAKAASSLLMYSSLFIIISSLKHTCDFGRILMLILAE